MAKAPEKASSTGNAFDWKNPVASVKTKLKAVTTTEETGQLPLVDAQSGASAFNPAAVIAAKPKESKVTEAKTLTQEEKDAIAKSKADLAAKTAAEKAAKKAAADAAKAEKAKATDAAKAEKAKLAAERKAATEARIAELKAAGKNYTGSMLALTDKVKSGLYVKSKTGQLRSTDDLAVALDGVEPTGVIALGLSVLALPENPYAKLNVGQQSMNLRNRMRGALKKGTLKLDAITAYVKTNDLDISASLEAKAKAKADAAAAKKADADAKAALKAAAAEAAKKDKLVTA